MREYLLPLGEIKSSHRTKLLILQLSLIILVWYASGSTVIPKPDEILTAIIRLIQNGALREFASSIGLCVQAMGIAIISTLTISYLSKIPLFSFLSFFTGKLRFLPPVGLNFLFMKITSDIQSEKLWLLVYGISVFFATSVYTIMSNTDEQNEYAKTLKLNNWIRMREVIIYGTSADVFESVKQNFAMAWMMLASIENLCKTDGGIGVILSDSNKYFRFDQVYAILIMILLAGIVIDFLLDRMKLVLFPWST